MSRATQFYAKYNLETPEQKKEREEAELKAKKKAARKAKAAVKKQVAEEIGDFTGITKDREGVVIQKMTDERIADKTPYEILDELITEHNIPIAQDYIACEKEVLLLIERNAHRRGYEEAIAENTKLQMEKDDEEMNAEQMKTIVAETVAAMTSNRTQELELQLKLQEARNREFELQVELARLSVQKHLVEGKVEEVVEFELSSLAGKVEEVTAISQVKEQFKEKSTKRSRKAKVIVEEPVVKEALIPTQYLTLKGGINWKAVRAAGQFETLLIKIINDAKEQGIDVLNGKHFKTFSSVCNGAYQQYMIDNKGTRGAWKVFVEQNILA